MSGSAVQAGKRATYPAYTPSGMDWVGDVPEHWEVHRLKHIASVQFSSVDKHTKEDETPVRLCNYVDVYYNDFIKDGIDFMPATATRSEIDRFHLRQGDVLITKDSEAWDDIAVPAYVAEEFDGVLCGYHLAHIRPDLRKVLGEYLFRAFRSRGVNDQFRVAANGITRFGLGKYWLDNGLFPVPPLDEQKAIAAFLDRETARIDGLIEKKRRQIELLQEKRSALISHAVTKGLDPNAPMKDSGIEWLGQVPEHWETKRLRHISPRLGVGLVINPSTYVDDDGEVPFFFGSNVAEFRLVPEGARRITADSNAQLTPSRLSTGDIVTVRVGAPGISAVVPPELDGSNCASIMITRGSRSFVSQWLCYLLNSAWGKYQVDRVAYGAAQRQFNIGHAVDFVYPVPPKEEQGKIAAALDAEYARHTRLIDMVQDSIDMLREHRTALISAAVTGKIDVRGEMCDKV